MYVPTCRASCNKFTNIMAHLSHNRSHANIDCFVLALAQIRLQIITVRIIIHIFPSYMVCNIAYHVARENAEEYYMCGAEFERFQVNPKIFN